MALNYGFKRAQIILESDEASPTECHEERAYNVADPMLETENRKDEISASHLPLVKGRKKSILGEDGCNRAKEQEKCNFPHLVQSHPSSSYPSFQTPLTRAKFY